MLKKSSSEVVNAEKCVENFTGIFTHSPVYYKKNKLICNEKVVHAFYMTVKKVLCKYEHCLSSASCDLQWYCKCVLCNSLTSYNIQNIAALLFRE